MAYKPPESKREGCHYPNCSGYLEVPFCCHDPESFSALKAALAQLETPKREWVGLTDIDIHVLKMNHDKVKVVYTDRAEDLTVLGQDVDVNGLINAIQTKLKEKNGG